MSLNLLPLLYRRELNDIFLLYKFKSGLMLIDCKKYFAPVTCHYETRNFDANNFDVTVSCHTHFVYNVKMFLFV